VNSAFKLKLYEQGAKASFYTVHIEGEPQSEFDKFLDNPENNANSAFPEFLARMDEILQKYGCQDRFFKERESKFTDNVVALWRDDLRLYCCKYGNIILILGLGGVKKTRTYQQNDKLNQAVMVMATVARRMDEKIREKEIRIQGNLFIGDLEFPSEE
jgi:hypothetical protein